MKDQFITIKNASKFQLFYFECAAEGNPTPLINWYRRDGSNIKDYQPYSHYVSFTTKDLKSNQNNVYVCNVSNSIGSAIRKIIVSLITEIGPDLLNDTLNLIRFQPSINSQQALNITILASSIQDSLNSMACSTLDPCICDRFSKIASAAGAILLEVNTKLEEDTLNLESSKTLFIGNAGVVQSSLKLWVSPLFIAFYTLIKEKQNKASTQNMFTLFLAGCLAFFY